MELPIVVARLRRRAVVLRPDTEVETPTAHLEVEGDTAGVAVDEADLTADEEGSTGDTVDEVVGRDTAVEGVTGEEGMAGRADLDTLEVRDEMAVMGQEVVATDPDLRLVVRLAEEMGMALADPTVPSAAGPHPTAQGRDRGAGRLSVVGNPVRVAVDPPRDQGRGRDPIPAV